MSLKNKNIFITGINGFVGPYMVASNVATSMK